MTNQEIDRQAALRALECEKSVLEAELKIMVSDQVLEVAADHGTDTYTPQIRQARQVAITDTQASLLELQKRFERV